MSILSIILYLWLAKKIIVLAVAGVYFVRRRWPLPRVAG